MLIGDLDGHLEQIEFRWREMTSGPAEESAEGNSPGCRSLALETIGL